MVVATFGHFLHTCNFDQVWAIISPDVKASWASSIEPHVVRRLLYQELFQIVRSDFPIGSYGAANLGAQCHTVTPRITPLGRHQNF